VKLPVERWCNSMSYSPDGRQLAVACADGSVRLYAMPAVTPEKTITVHRDEVTQAAFSPDGKRLATASLDKSFHVSPLQFDELHAVAKRMQAATAREPVSRAAP
jgi:WD40 repeat protein